MRKSTRRPRFPLWSWKGQSEFIRDMKRLAKRDSPVFDLPMQLEPSPRSWDKGPEGDKQENRKEKHRGSLGWVMAVVMGVVVKVQRALRTAKATAWEKVPMGCED